MRRQDITDEMLFGRLTTKEKMGYHAKRGVIWRCLCSCGKEHTVFAEYLANGDSRSCGCLIKDINSERLRRHGCSHRDHKNFREYNTWLDMKKRCNLDSSHKKHESYHRRGISVCESWINSFENFFSDMGAIPSKNHSLDRKNNDLGYSPENCRWATRHQQANNRSNNRVVLWDGKKYTVQELCNKFNIKSGIVYRRLNRGWSLERSLVEKSHYKASNPTQSKKP